MLNTRYNINDFFCENHGTALKIKETKSIVLQKIVANGLNTETFLGKLRQRTAWVCACCSDEVDHYFPFEEGDLYIKYLKMMSKCDKCEEKAVDTKMAKFGKERCSECSEYVLWHEFSEGCDDTECPQKDSKNVCFECADYLVCEFCDRVFCCDCRYCESCDGVFCADCRDGGYCNFFFCIECNRVFYCDSCQENVCLHCHRDGDCEISQASTSDDDDDLETLH